MAYDVKKTDHLFVPFNRLGHALRDSKGNTKIYKDLKTLKQHNKEDDGKPSMSASDYYVDFMEYAPADKWIPVSERFPEQGQEVIIYTGNILKPTVMAYQFWNPKYDTWTHVTHWMPMPDGPEEDKK